MQNTELKTTLPELLAPAIPQELALNDRVSWLRCHCCHQQLPPNRFSTHTSGGVAYKNKRCNSCRMKRQEGSSVVKERLQYILEIKAKPCTDCGRTFPPECMDFDHQPGTIKKMTVANMWHSCSMESIKEEVAKCELVCACCHRTRTKGRPFKGGRKPGFAPERLARIPRATERGVVELMAPIS